MAELMAKAGDGDFLRSLAVTAVQLLMETDVDGLIGAVNLCSVAWPRSAFKHTTVDDVRGVILDIPPWSMVVSRQD